MIDQLPPANRLNEAILNDPEYAREIASRPDPVDKEPWSPKVSEYGLVPVMLREVIHGLSGVQQAVTASAGAKPKKFKPFPGPRTEVDRERDRQDKEFILELGGLFGFEESDFF